MLCGGDKRKILNQAAINGTLPALPTAVSLLFLDSNDQMSDEVVMPRLAVSIASLHIGAESANDRSSAITMQAMKP